MPPTVYASNTNLSNSKEFTQLFDGIWENVDKTKGAAKVIVDLKTKDRMKHEVIAARKVFNPSILPTTGHRVGLAIIDKPWITSARPMSYGGIGQECILEHSAIAYTRLRAMILWWLMRLLIFSSATSQACSKNGTTSSAVKDRALNTYCSGYK